MTLNPESGKSKGGEDKGAIRPPSSKGTFSVISEEGPIGEPKVITRRFRPKEGHANSPIEEITEEQL